MSALTLEVAFTPMNGGTWSHGSDGWAYRTGGHVGTCANVNLPSGALLEAITTYSQDTDATFNVEFSLFSINLASSFGTQPFLYITSGTPGIQRLLHTLTTPITINNDRRAYALCVFQSSTTSSTRSMPCGPSTGSGEPGPRHRDLRRRPDHPLRLPFRRGAGRVRHHRRLRR